MSIGTNRLIAGLGISMCALSQNAAPAGTAPVPAPTDMPYPGTIALAVDVTDLDHRVFSVTERLPVQPGPLTLLYPEWIPGSHAPRGTISGVGGLVISANGKRLEWSRDTT